MLVCFAVHPYHQHQFHFQLTNLNGADQPGVWNSDVMRLYEWRDTVPVPVGPAGVTMRFQPVDFAGETILHCHLLPHEDL